MMQELTDQELNETEGGIAPLIIAAVVVVVAVGLCTGALCSTAR